MEPEHSGNVGSIARLMMNFGLDDLWLVSPKSPIGDEALAMASHAKEFLRDASKVSSLEEALQGVSLVAGTTSILPTRSANLLRTSVTPEEFTRIVGTTSGMTALILGRESRGLCNAELEECDIIVTIPSSHEYRALNIASAAAILFYELWKSQYGYHRIYFKEADRDALRRLVGVFDELCSKALVSSYKRGLAVRAFLNVLARAPTSEREASLLLGVLRKTVQRIAGEL